MPIIPAQLIYYLSGGAGNSDPDASLGGAISSTSITSGNLNNLFDDVDGDEAASGDTEYRGFYFKNTNSSLPLQNPKIWIDTQTASADDSFSIALADEAIDVEMATITDESTAPSGGVTFTTPLDKSSGLSIGTLAAGSWKGIWIRRTVNASAAALSSNSGTLRVEGDTAA